MIIRITLIAVSCVAISLSMFAGERACSAPAITSFPNSVTAYAGETVVFKAAVGGSKPMKLQWYKASSLCPEQRVNGVPVEGADTATLVVKADTTAAYWLKASNGCDEAISTIAIVSAPGRPMVDCSASAKAGPGVHVANMYLLGSRFAVSLFARDQRTGTTGNGEAVQLNDVFGYYTVFALTQNTTDPVVFVKILDGRPVNGKYWVFFAGLTDVEYTLTVYDTSSGQQRVYTKPAGSTAGGFDTSAFPVTGNTTSTTSSSTIGSSSSSTTTRSSSSTSSFFSSSTTTTTTSGTATMTWSFTDGCNDGVSTQLKLFDKTYNLVYPGNGQVYIITSTPGTIRIACTRGNNICYGATQYNNTQSYYWGLGIDGTSGCSSCCYTCNDVTIGTINLSCN